MRKDNLFKLRSIFTTLTLCFFLSIASAQNVSVRGVVTDIDNEPIIGATIVVKGNATQGTATDADGKYTLANVSPNAVLTVTYVGMKTQEVAVNGRTVIDIVMSDDTELLDEVVVVGFGTQKKVNLTGAVSSVNAKDLTARPVSNVSQALQGLVPDLNFSMGDRGGDISQDMVASIRGTGTVGKGSKAAPLVLIDGMEGNMNAINPQDIESISVLKDAAASSIYGSRAPFGVILITTKRGKAGKTSINYNNNFRWVQAINMPEVADAYTYANYFKKMAENSASWNPFDAERMKAIKGYMDGTITTTTNPASDDKNRWDWIGNTNTRWYDELFGGTAFTHEHSLSVSGGADKMQYYASLNYLDQNGMLRIRRDNIKRYTATGRITAQPLSWLDFTYGTKFIRRDFFKPSVSNDRTLYHNVAKRWPVEPIKDPNGNYMSDTLVNPLLYGGDDNTQTDYLYQQFQVVAEPVKNWKIFGEFNYKTITSTRDMFQLKVPMWNVDGSMRYANGYTTNKTTNANEKTNYFNTNLYSEYAKEFESGHYLKGMIGFQAEANRWERTQITRNDLMAETLPVPSLATGNLELNAYNLSHWATAGFFGRINYNYKERYLAEVNLRYDGTSRFAKDKRWNLFPSVSVGWNLAKEAFMEDYLDLVNTLKLRGSWGELGNQNTESLYPYIQLMKYYSSDNTSDRNNWLINGKRPNGAKAPALISALMGWETIQTLNVGFDLSMLKNRLNVTFDWYNRKTLNMVGPAPVLPAILGTDVPRVNNADMQSTGFGLEISWRDRIRDFSYEARVVLSDDRQKILRYPNPTNSLSEWRAGQYIGDIWGLETIGIAKSKEEMDKHLASLSNGGQNEIGTQWMAGDIMYKDLDGDGKISKGATTDKPHDLKLIGNSSPRYNFGVDLSAAYKGFDVKVFLQGVAKRDYWLGDNMFWGAHGGIWQSGVFTNHLDFFREKADDFWSENINAYYPRVLDGGDGKNHERQTKYLQNAAYMRLKNLQLGYTIPASISNKLKVSNLRIFISAENLFTLTNLPRGFDPETLGTGYGADWGSGPTNTAKAYPMSRTFSAGLNINF
ncbi:MAG: TonB-dependent receptor [Bacteroidia bacterium]|nr:TonB-dependent receptor [Bacteroidia bacterium]